MENVVTEAELVGMSTARLECIKPAMQAYVNRQNNVGLSTMVVRKGEIVHFEHCGLIDVASNIPMTRDAMFRIYSMTKPIISVAMLTLYEDGLFKLSDPVAKFIPAFSDPRVLEKNAAGELSSVNLVRPITVHDLLTHTAGFTYDFVEDTPVGELYRQARLCNNAERSLEEFVLKLAELPLAYQPGTRWHYGLAFDVVGYLIEIISGQPLAAFLKDTIFRPLGMTDTDFCVPLEKRYRLATMYGREDIFSPNMTLSKMMEARASGDNECIDVSATYPVEDVCFGRGGHGLFSTASDYARFAQMLLNNGEFNGERILDPESIDLMHKNHLSPRLLPYELIRGRPVKGYGFGLGVRVLMNRDYAEIPNVKGDTGWTGAAKTIFWIDPVEAIVGIFMMQDMLPMEFPENEFKTLVYQAIID